MILKTEKKCTLCLSVLPIEMFSITNKGTTYRGGCKPCQVKRVQEYKKNLPKEVMEVRRQQQCANRRAKYSQDENYRSKNLSSNLEWRTKNREIARLNTAKWRKEKPEKLIETKRKYYENNKEKISIAGLKYRQKNLDKLRQYSKEYYKNNVGQYMFYAASRRAKELKCSPSWSVELTDFVFKEAQELTRLRKSIFGFPWHVDHIIPLQGKEVTGLHVWNNFQVIPASENLRKRNTYRSI